MKRVPESLSSGAGFESQDNLSRQYEFDTE